MDFEYRNLIESCLRQVFDTEVRLAKAKSLHGGSINRVYHIHVHLPQKSPPHDRELVVKINSERPLGFLEKEMQGLNALASAVKEYRIPIRIPQPLTVRSHPPNQFLIMEYIPVSGRGFSAPTWSTFGRALASLHLRTGEGVVAQKKERPFGWHEHTYIGNNIQYNTLEKNWVNFFSKHRLQPQLEWGRDRFPTAIIKKLEGLIQHLSDYLPPHPHPSLLHGDLWTGNFFFSEGGEPVIFDPAVYYGHAETDLAMAELFGSFPPAFYQGYHSLIAKDRDTDLRKAIYNLYHYLNHFNLFGGAYLSSIQHTLEQIFY